MVLQHYNNLFYHSLHCDDMSKIKITSLVSTDVDIDARIAFHIKSDESGNNNCP